MDFRLISFPGSWLLCPAAARRLKDEIVTMPASFVHPATRLRALEWMAGRKS